jgi:hypothetical protein
MMCGSLVAGRQVEPSTDFRRSATGVGFHEAVRHLVGDGIDAGARKSGNMVAAVMGFERLHVEFHLKDREPASAGESQRQRSQATYPERIVSPGEDNNRD